MNIINDVALKLKSMNVSDVDIYRAIHEINANYILLNKTKKAVELTKMLNKSAGCNFDYTPMKALIGITFEELFIKSLAFSSNSFDYISERCIVIPKTVEVTNFLNSVDMMYDLTNEKNPDYTSNKINLFNYKFEERIQKEFEKNFENLLPENIGIIHRSEKYPIRNEYAFIELVVNVQGNEEETQKQYLKEDSLVHSKIDELLESFAEKLFGEKREIHYNESVLINRDLLSLYGAKKIFRTKKALFNKNAKGKKSKRDYSPPKPTFFCYTTIFLHYNQFCDIAERGSLY